MKSSTDAACARRVGRMLHLYEAPPSIRAKWGPVHEAFGHRSLFRAESDEERSFVRALRSAGIHDRVRVTRIWSLEDRDLPRVDWLYLAVREGRSHPEARVEVEGCHAFIQRTKVSLDPTRCKRLDIMELWVIGLPRPLLLVSRAMRDLLEAEGATGYELIPCLDARREWSPSVRSIETRAGHGESTGWFQLVVTNRVEPPELFGALQRACTRCGARSISSLWGTEFERAGMPGADFGVVTSVRKGDGLFELAVPVVLASGRVLSAIRRARLKGLRRATPEVGHSGCLLAP